MYEYILQKYAYLKINMIWGTGFHNVVKIGLKLAIVLFLNC